MMRSCCESRPNDNSTKASFADLLSYARLRADRYIQHMVVQIQIASILAAADVVALTVVLQKVKPDDLTLHVALKLVALFAICVSLAVTFRVLLRRTDPELLGELRRGAAEEEILVRIDQYVVSANEKINTRQFHIQWAMVLLFIGLLSVIVSETLKSV